MGQRADPGLADGGEVSAGIDRDDSGQSQRRLSIDPADARVRIGRAHEGNMGQARETEIVGKLATALQQSRRVGAWHGAADIAVRARQHTVFNDIRHRLSPVCCLRSWHDWAGAASRWPTPLAVSVLT